MSTYTMGGICCIRMSDVEGQICNRCGRWITFDEDNLRYPYKYCYAFRSIKCDPSFRLVEDPRYSSKSYPVYQKSHSS